MTDEEERLRRLLGDRAFVCKLHERRYSCMYCNKGWGLNDPGFRYWRPFGAGNWMVKAGLARVGDPMNVYDAATDKPISAGFETLGRFAQCVDREACDRRRRNLHNGVQLEHLSLIDEIDHRVLEMKDAKAAMAREEKENK